MLSTDEAVWFDHFTLPVVTPIFFLETLSDLEKAPREGKTAEEEVGIIAIKTPEMSGAPVYFHQELVVNNLLGAPVPMDGRIPVAGFRPVRHQGKSGAVLEITPEARAFERWKDGDFFGLERTQARVWRQCIARIDLAGLRATMNSLGVSPKTCRSLADAKMLADRAVNALTKSTGRFAHALEALAVPSDVRQAITYRWKRLKKVPLKVFAPYAAHSLTVETFFRIAVGAGHISAGRATNQVDMAYLNYLPFCQFFVSADKLHRSCAPLFLRPDQAFVWGSDLKSSLATVDRYFGSLAPEIKAQGIHRFARTLPDAEQGCLRELFECYTPKLLKRQGDPMDQPPSSIERQKELAREIRGLGSAPEAPLRRRLVDMDAVDSMVIKRSVRRRRGSWFQIDPSIRDEQD
jgi:hypothetical protein